MKRKLLGMVAAAAALFSACQTLEYQVTVEPAEEAKDASSWFTASLGTETKTYLEAVDGLYKVRWETGDHFTVYDANSIAIAEDVYLVNGAGTSTGEFTGSLEAETYLAYYGYRYNQEDGTFYPNIPNYQGGRYEYNADTDSYYMMDSFKQFMFPMAALSDSKNFEFKNIASVLKVSIVGDNKYIRNIVITPNDPTIAISGSADLVVDGDRPALVMHEANAGGFIQYDVESDLSPVEPFDCYVVLPSQTYKGGFTVTINSEDGYMDVTTTADVVMEQSQIRAIPTITYEQEHTSSWAMIGDQSSWSEDVPMTYEDGYWVLRGVEIPAYSEFKFRANKDWAVNFGGYLSEASSINTATPLTQGGANLYIENDGVYDLYLDVFYGVVYIMDEGVAPGHYNFCEDYYEVASLYDDDYVLVDGYVLAYCDRGFILNIGSYHNNCINVYQGPDQSMYAPGIGDFVTVYAKKSTYFGLPELKDPSRIDYLGTLSSDPGYGYYHEFVDGADFASFSYDAYLYVKYSGILKNESGSYYVYVGDQTDVRGYLFYPSQNVEALVDQTVFIEGYFIGFSGNGKNLCTIVKYISSADGSGSTEDVVPGDDIVVTKASARIAGAF